jgi:hypothetical protein
MIVGEIILVSPLPFFFLLGNYLYCRIKLSISTKLRNQKAPYRTCLFHRFWPGIWLQRYPNPLFMFGWVMLELNTVESDYSAVQSWLHPPLAVKRSCPDLSCRLTSPSYRRRPRHMTHPSSSIHTSGWPSPDLVAAISASQYRAPAAGHRQISSLHVLPPPLAPL